MESILTSIKKMLGITEEYDHFDADLIMHINSVFMILTQLGVGPSEGFRIEDELATWNDIIPSDKNFEIIKSYMHLKVKLLFDPPLSSVVLGSMERMISEFEFRINILAEQAMYEPQKEPSNPTVTPGILDNPKEDTKFEVEGVTIEDHNVVLSYNGNLQKDVPSLEVELPEGNMHVTNNGNYDVYFSMKNGSLQINNNLDDDETFDVTNVYTVDGVAVVEHEGECVDPMPKLNISFDEGVVNAENNGNNGLVFSVNNTKELEVIY